MVIILYHPLQLKLAEALERRVALLLCIRVTPPAHFLCSRIFFIFSLPSLLEIILSILSLAAPLNLHKKALVAPVMEECMISIDLICNCKIHFTQHHFVIFQMKCNELLRNTIRAI
jgi:hypothetical protein